MVKAKWSGKWPNLCQGDWSLKINNKDVTKKIPEELRYSPMYTYNTYRRWYFEDWMEVWDHYEDGLECDEWIEENKDWLNDITEDLEMQKEIFKAFNENDWRFNSCGGCI